MRVAACLMPLLAGCVDGPPVRAEAKTDHHTADGFRNPPGSPKRRAGLWTMLTFFARRLGEALDPPEVPAGHVLDEAAALAALAEADGQDSLTWLGHAAFLIRTGGKTILTDPFLSERASPLAFAGPRRFVAPGISIARLPPVDAIVLSHNHYDHLDLRAIEAMPGKERIVAIVPLGLGAYFRERGYREVREVDWYDEVRLGPVTVTALPAIHFSSRTPFDRNRTLWMSVAITSPTQNLFFGGDSALGPVFRDIGASHGPFSAAMVGIGAYLPIEIMRPTHTDPEEAVRLARDIGARILVAMHWGTVVLTDEPPFEPPARFRAAAAAAGLAEDRAWLMRIGETRILPRDWPRN